MTTSAPEIQTGEPGVAIDRRREVSLAAPNEETQITSPASLIQYAIDHKMPAAELQALVGLHERMEDRNARKMFFEALEAFQHECPPIAKNKTANIPTKGGGSYSFKYAELDEIERHVKPYLKKHGLAYSFDSTVVGNGALLTNTCTLRHVAGHSEPSSFTLPTTSASAMTDQQRFSAANNFAKRQTLAAILGISITGKEIPDDEVDPATVGEDQATAIDDLINESGGDRALFLALFDAGTVSDIRAVDYPRAITLLNAKLEKKRGKKS